MSIAILKYTAGNIFSVQAAIKRLGADSIVTDNKNKLLAADKIIIPGQGEAANTMKYLKDNHLDDLIKSFHQPVLGICIGMQIMCEKSEEGNVDCLGIFPNVMVKRITPENKEKIPHMGWNTIQNPKSELFQGIKDESYFYFVHSYFVPTCEYTIATSDYAGKFSAAIKKDNFYAVQFHPEKSEKIGEKLFLNFLNL